MRLLVLLAAALASAACAAPPVAPAPADRAAPAASDERAPDDAEDAGWTALATTVEGRPIRHVIVGDGPRRVLWIGGIHGNEREGARATAELPGAFSAEPGAAERVTLLVIEDLNPDGSAHGTRGNARSVDLNRNFPAPSFQPSSRHGAEPLSEPESRALAELVASWRPDLVLVAHSWRDREFVNYDGPARELAERFAATSGFELRGSDELAPTPGSLGSWAGVTLGIPVLTLEWRNGRDPLDAWHATRAAILQAIVGD